MIRFIPCLLGPVTAALLLSHCTTAPGAGGAPDSELRSFVDSPGGARIDYRDEDSAHTITLFGDGTYRFESVGMYGGTSQTRQGLWRWKKTDSHGAEMELDQEKWTLNFVSPDSALAFNQSGARTYAFQFRE